MIDKLNFGFFEMERYFLEDQKNNNNQFTLEHLEHIVGWLFHNACSSIFKSSFLLSLHFNPLNNKVTFFKSLPFNQKVDALSFTWLLIMVICITVLTFDRSTNMGRTMLRANFGINSFVKATSRTIHLCVVVACE